jgi:WD40 repeat protein/predicted Ser/Thr protein kinase
LTPERYQKVKQLFGEVCELAPQQRAAHLERVCAQDAELRAEVETLLAHDGQPLPVEPRISAASALARLGAGATGSSASFAFSGGVDGGLPDRVGRYRVLSLLGQGGMGTVYLAEQEHPRRQVALKVVHAGAASHAVLRRFSHETSILGQLAHPGIAHIYEAGVADMRTADGLAVRCPFFAMEYVRGEALGEYVEHQRPSVPQRLALIARICDAVHHAHQRSVVHRDLKPGNILVEAQGQPKILDFGIARVTDVDVQTVTMKTEVGQLVGTIPYMSPEQVTGVSANVDTRSDVYALGVICYELLTGSLPHDVTDHSIPEAVRMIREDEPTRLSSVDTLFRGDLDTIIGKALEKDKQRRYQSASEFAADIRNHLASRPIAARAPTTFYQLRMFARRNRALVGGVLATVMALLIGIVGISVQAERVARERDVARQAEQLARQAEHLADKRAYAANIAAAQAAMNATDVAAARQRLDAASPHLRNWEWRYLRSRLDSSLTTLASHEHHVWSVDYGPDGSWLITGSVDGTAKLWDVAGGRVLRTMHVGGRVRSVAVAPDGRSTAVVTEHGSLSVWSIPTGDKIVTLSSNGASTGVSFSPDGALIASASSDGTARIWNADTGELMTILKHPSWVQDVCFSPDSTRVATSCRDNIARLWDLTTRAPALKIPVLPSTREWDFIHSWAVAIDPGGQILATGCHDGVIKLWSAATGELQESLGGHSSRVRSLAFAPDGDRLASASDDGTVRIWDPATGVELTRLSGHEGCVFDVDFSPDGARLASVGADRTVRLWYALSSPRLTRLRGHRNRGILALDTSPDGTQIISVGGDRAVRLWDVESGACTAAMRGHEHGIYAVAFSPDGRLAVSGSRDTTVRLWNVETRQEATTLRGHDGAVWAVAFSPCGTRAASASLDGTIRLWDVATGSGLLTMTSETEQLTALAFSPGGMQLATGSMAGVIEFWDVRTGCRSGVVAGHEDRIWTVAYNPDGTRLVSASSDRTLKLWSPRAGELLTTLQGHADYARYAVFSPDGSRVASVSYDRTLRLWDPETGETVLSFRAHLDWPCSLAFSPDGTWLVSAGASIRLWETSRPSQRTMEQRWARVAAEDLVDRLFADTEDDTEVRALIESDETIGAEVRRYALQVARFRADDRETEDN